MGDAETTYQVSNALHRLEWTSKEICRSTLVQLLRTTAQKKDISGFERLIDYVVDHSQKYSNATPQMMLDNLERMTKVSDIIINHKERYHTNVSKQIMGPTQSMFLHVRELKYSRPRAFTHN